MHLKNKNINRLLRTDPFVFILHQVCVSLATYTLFLLDARRQFFWEKLDDYLYYVRAFGNSVEFSFGILLFINGAWILVFESGKSRYAPPSLLDKLHSNTAIV